MTDTTATSKHRILCDTDVVSYLFSGHSLAQFFHPYLDGQTLAVSFMTVAQLFYGTYKAEWGVNRRVKLENHLKNYVVLPYDYQLCLKWAEVRSNCERKGFSIEHGDCWIAASALRHECALATNNGRHFSHVDGLTLISPGLNI